MDASDAWTPPTAALASATTISPIEELIRRHVLEPLGVEDVTAEPPAERRPVFRGLLGRARPPTRAERLRRRT
ncbi:hypothetical protein [Streptomyces heilongjiangensis]|uniref:Uncharacterized protein n=1 Tax=Streptomyces heilongjiangensis TaxID=945052 RepID=A0ABW1BD04_9ACTN|nr:hypothetical protein [Streptomyces heilongjiangensis]MDC2949810.1 hypothetical protein [Streptomyces heilongjiangensis]